MVFPGSVGTKTSQAVSGELPFWFLFGLGSLCWSNNSSPVVSSGGSNLPKSGTVEPRAPTQGTAVQFLDEWSRGPSFRAGTPVKYKFIKNHFHQKPLSSKTNFIKKPLSSKNHFHQKPVSSKTTSIKNQFHQKPFSSETIFIRKNETKGWDSQYSPCLCEGVAGRRPATPSHKHGSCPPFGFQQAFMWSIAGRRPAMLHMKVC